MPVRELAAYLVSAAASEISPWWRFRLWNRLAGGDAYRNIEDVPSRWKRIAPHNYEVELSESDWMERYALHAGHFYQDEVTALLLHRITPGSYFVDIGANIGFVTLTASWLVGSSGHVFAIEPNCELIRRLENTMLRNNIANVTTFETAAGDAPGKVRLITGKHHGTNRIAAGDDAPEGPEVPIARVDDLLLDKIPDGKPLFVKIDAEGAEVGVLHGMRDMLRRPNSTFLVEVGDGQSAHFGTSSQDVFDIFEPLGYRPHIVRLSPFSRRIKLEQIHGPLGYVTYDVYFCK